MSLYTLHIMLDATTMALQDSIPKAFLVVSLYQIISQSTSPLEQL